jgi:hypothetical protein
MMRQIPSYPDLRKDPGMPRPQIGSSKSIVAENRVGDRSRKAFTPMGIGDSGSLRPIGQKAAFDQDRGQSILSQNPIATMPDAAINAVHRLDHPWMDQSSQAVPALVIVIGLDPIGAFA